MKRANIIPIISVLAAACVLIFIVFLGLKNKVPNGTVRIYVGGELYDQQQLGEERDILISQPDGKKNLLHLSKNGFYMKESNCITLQCIAQGQVTLDNYYKRALGTDILCAHHQVRVELVLTDRTPIPDMPDI